MIMINIHIKDSLCKIRIYNNILFVDLEKKLKMNRNSNWIDLTIFSIVLKGLLLLFEKNILSRVNKDVLIG
jgi:hypothetical protein